MEKYVIHPEQLIIDIADAIRDMNNSTSGYTITDMPAAIRNISGEGGGGSSQDITIDAELSDTSENPVQNKVIKTAINSLVNSLTNFQRKIIYSDTDIYSSGNAALDTGRIAIIYDNGTAQEEQQSGQEGGE